MGEKLKILIVDDEQDFRDYFEYFLGRELGHDVIMANNGKDGLWVVTNALEEWSRFDVIISDYKMPTMNGLEMADKIRKFDNDIPIIVISAVLEEPEEIKEALKNGTINCFLRKPFEEDEILKIIEELTETKK